MKDAVKAAEKETAELREELLAIKQERKRVKAITQTLEQEIELLKVKNENMVKENLKLSENIKVIEAKVKELVKDKITLEEARGSLEPSNDTQCEFCDEEIERICDLKKHIREKHLVDKASQVFPTSSVSNSTTSKFEEHQCFYCDKILKSNNDVDTHSTDSHELFLSDYYCNKCRKNARIKQI